MRARHDLYAGKPVYARRRRFISGEIKLYALDMVYARGNQFMRARHDLYAGKPVYVRSLRFISGEIKLYALELAFSPFQHHEV